MSTQPERFDTFSAALAASFASGTLPEASPELLASLVGDPVVSPPAPNGTDSPDAHGQVALDSLDSSWSGWRHNIAEIANGDLSDDQRGQAQANLSHANGVYTVGLMRFIGTCYASSGSKVDVHNRIANTISWPDVVHNFHDVDYNLGTVQGVHDWCVKLGHPPGANPNATPFPHPGG